MTAQPPPPLPPPNPSLMGTVEKPATLPWDPDPRFVVEPEPVAPDDDQRGLVAGCAFVAAVGVLAFLAGVALGWVM